MAHDYHRIVVLTGAGISAESGVPVFRGPDGLWEGRRVDEVATHEALTRDLWGVNAFFNELRAKAKTVQPNPAHAALVRLEEVWGNDFLLVTQNIDPLHQAAGSQRVIPMHGELASVECLACGAFSRFDGDVTQATLCPACGQEACLRPDIVLFNEIPKRMDEIQSALSACDLFIAVGTSGAVYPAAGFVDLAHYVGAHTIEVNLAETGRSDSFAEHLVGPAGQKLPELVDRLIAARQA
jgi:NAD-dependent deacetylase